MKIEAQLRRTIGTVELWRTTMTRQAGAEAIVVMFGLAMAFALPSLKLLIHVTS